MFAKIWTGICAVGGAMGRALPTVVRDITGIAAIGSIAYGSYLVYPPAGFIVGGAIVLIGVIMASVASRKAG